LLLFKARSDVAHRRAGSRFTHPRPRLCMYERIKTQIVPAICFLLLYGVALALIPGEASAATFELTDTSQSQNLQMDLSIKEQYQSFIGIEGEVESFSTYWSRSAGGIVNVTFKWWACESATSSPTVAGEGMTVGNYASYLIANCSEVVSSGWSPSSYEFPTMEITKVTATYSGAPFSFDVDTWYVLETYGTSISGGVLRRGSFASSQWSETGLSCMGSSGSTCTELTLTPAFEIETSFGEDSRILFVVEPPFPQNYVTPSTTVPFEVEYFSNVPVPDRICVEIDNLTLYQSLIPLCEDVTQSGRLSMATTTVLTSSQQYRWRFVLYGENDSIIDITEWGFFTVVVPPYSTFDPGTSGFPYGSLPAGTATGTALSDLTLQCDPEAGFFENSVCNLAVLLFVPGQGSLVSLNENLNTLLTKQPFSAFAEFRTAWNEAQKVQDVTQASFTLIIFGNNILIIGTSTLDAIVSDSSQNTIRQILIMGMWIGWGWWAFNRVRHLF